MHVKNIGTERLPYMHNLLIICCCATNYSHYLGPQAIEIFIAHSFSRSEIQEQPFGWFCLRGSPEGAGSHVLLFPPSVPGLGGSTSQVTHHTVVGNQLPRDSQLQRSAPSSVDCSTGLLEGPGNKAAAFSHSWQCESAK